jgi:nucleotidyltransferase/DNA polymerase involved in DNA repair
VVLAADAAAQAAGLRVGMPATKAQVLVPGLAIQDADPSADADAIDRLALWMLQRFAPIVAADLPDGIVIDSTGADHLHGGEKAMLGTLIAKLAGIGIRARGAVADTWGTAHALARYAARPVFISQAGVCSTDIAPLPIAAFGEQKLYRIAPVASDVPERSVQHIPAKAPETGAEWPGHWPRPSRLLAHPEPIDTVALLPDHPPVSFTWRGMRRRVKRADGPERVFGEWWSATRS